MPTYKYICSSCRRQAQLFFSYAEYGSKTAVCPHCQSHELKRVYERVAVSKSAETRVDSFLQEDAIANLDENDPKSLGRFMRQMGNEVGDDMGAEFNEVVDRLESGQSPDSIEKAMPDLATPPPPQSDEA